MVGTEGRQRGLYRYGARGLVHLSVTSAALLPSVDPVFSSATVAVAGSTAPDTTSHVVPVGIIDSTDPDPVC